MNTLAIIIASAAASGGTGTAEYTIDLSQDTATLGDTVTVTVGLELTPGDAPFSGLSFAPFSVQTNDPLGPTGVVDNLGLGLGLAPDWMPLGNPGLVAGDDILGIEAGQFPINNSNFILTMYSFDYTVGDSTARDIVFNVLPTLDVVVFEQSVIDPHAWETFTDDATLEIMAVTPAPGALALLGLAGFAARRRRRG